MHYPDLLPYGNSSQLIAVGWLEPGREFATGSVEPEFAEKLVELLIEPWQPAAAAGHHACGFCRLSGGPATFSVRGVTGSPEVRMGVSNLWIPVDGFLFVTPSLSIHYIDAHGYSPPSEFRQAVLSCPPMRSMDYLKAILKNGSEGLVRGGSSPNSAGKKGDSSQI